MTQAERKEIQRKRMKEYFITSAKELIIEEGLEKVTTKKIGDRAGYSYATIYNYFENFSELVCICIEEFSDEMAKTLKLKANKIKPSRKKIEELVIISLRYSLDHINIYKLFLTDSIDFSYLNHHEHNRFIHPAYKLLVEMIGEASEFSHLPEEKKIYLANMVLFLLHSKIQFYVTLKDPKDEKVLEEEIVTNLNFLLDLVEEK